jgi:2-polyprenyl-3-methyl-5-hydroxy-6-metoxy-1,4-benzoquinol methylase
MKFRVSHFLQRQRFRTVWPYVRGDVLDLGCNYGQIHPRLSPEQYYVGVDSSVDIATWWQTNRPEIEFHHRNLNEDELNLGRRFDTVLMLAILEHLSRPGNILRQIPGLLNAGGRLVITTPSVQGDRIHHVGAKLGLFSQQAADEHQTQFTEESLKKLATSHGLVVAHYRSFMLGGNQLAVCMLPQ